MPGVCYVALGGALGASARYALSLLPVRGDFPVWTFLTNLLGAVVIGFLAGILAGRILMCQKDTHGSGRPDSAEALPHFPHFRWKPGRFWNREKC